MKIINKISGFILALGAFALFTVPVFAQSSYIPGAIQSSTLSTNPNGIITLVINFIFIIVGLIFFVMLVIGGVQWVTAGSAEDKRTEAQGRIVNAIIGVAIVAGSYLVVEIVSSLLGIGGIFGQSLFSTTACANGGTVCLNGSLK
jgi:hypothetical protein